LATIEIEHGYVTVCESAALREAQLCEAAIGIGLIADAASSREM
jgi:hypothetical protein